MEIRLLGPVELVHDGRALDIGGPRQRIVLAMLALNTNRVTPVEQLIDAVWNDSPPSTARAQIQICISALRKLLGDTGAAASILTRPPGYLLELAPGTLDSERFSALVTEARAHADASRVDQAAATLREALALWHGPALAGVPSDLIARGAALLEDRRFAALEERIRLDLALGRHEDVGGELRALCDEFPLREQLYGFLMLALYRSGRQADALDVCRRARATLIDEVGIEPGQELRDLETAILNRDSSLDLPPAATDPAHTAPGAAQPATAASAEPRDIPRQLPASIADFTGRDEQLEDIKQVLSDDTDPYAVRIVAISGKGGVGKSSLAVRVAHELADSFCDGHLYADLGNRDQDDAGSQLLARFLRALGVNGSAIPEDQTERMEMYRSRLASRRLLVILDDVSDEEQVLPVLPGSPTCAVILTSRTRLSGLPGGYFLDIPVFEVDLSLELLCRIVGAKRVDAERDEAIRLVEMCGGLPLALRIAGARLASRPHWRIAGLVQRLGDEARRLDEFVHRGLALRSTIELTYRGLDDRAQRLFRMFAQMDGPDFPAWTAAALLDTDQFDAEDLLERLVDAQVLDTVDYPGARTLRYRFHDLLRVFAREQLARTDSDTDRRAAQERVLGAWLGLAELAHRREYGGDFTVLHGDAARWRPTDEDPDVMDDPTQWWETERRSLVAAVRQAAEAGLDELCWDLALTSVSLFEAHGYFDDWRETARMGLAATERAGNRRGQAAMLYSAGSLAIVQQRLDEAAERFAVSLSLFEKAGDRHARALVLRNWAYVDGLRGRTSAMLDKYTTALELLREVGDRIGEAHVLRALAKFCIDGGDPDTARDMLDRALAICREVHSPRNEAQVLHRYAELYLRTDEIDEARQALHQVLLIVRDLGDQIGEAYALSSLGVVRFREGRLDSAMSMLRNALDLARRVGDRLVQGTALYTLGEVSMARGNHAVGASHLTDALAVFDDLDSTLWRAKTLILLADAHTSVEETELARTEVARATKLLEGIDSAEADAFRTQLDTILTALPEDDRHTETAPGGVSRRGTR